LFSCVVSLSAVLAIAMQSLGSLPYFYQRIVIRIVQPVTLSGLTIVWYLAVKNPIYFAAIIGGMAFLIFVCYIRYRNRENNSEGTGKIAPIQSPGIKLGLVVNHKNDGEIQMSRRNTENSQIGSLNMPVAVGSSSDSEVPVHAYQPLRAISNLGNMSAVNEEGSSEGSI